MDSEFQGKSFIANFFRVKIMQNDTVSGVQLRNMYLYV